MRSYLEDIEWYVPWWIPQEFPSFRELLPAETVTPQRQATSTSLSRTVIIPARQSPSPLVIIDDKMITRIAGLSGALAVGFAAYGSHVLREKDVDERRKTAFETASRYHLIHSAVLLLANRSRFPLLTSALFVSAIFLFCVPIYHYSITGNEKFRWLTPYGGVTFILGWLSFIL